MVITRKIEIFIAEKDKEIRKSYYDLLYKYRKVAVKVANMTASHMFVLDNTLPYLTEEDREKLTFLGVKGDKATRQNAPYVAASEAFKGQVSMEMLTNVIQNVSKSYREDVKNGGLWEKSLRSYKSTLPIPFKANSFKNLRKDSYTNSKGEERQGYFFQLMGIPFQMDLRKDHSRNRLIVDRVIEQLKFINSNGKEGEVTNYKMCTSSIAIEKKLDKKTEKKRQKIFLYLCVDIPTEKVKLHKDKVLYAYLGLTKPIVWACGAPDTDIWRSGISWGGIGNEREFNYRRRRIGEALKRLQKDCRYTKGGKGRNRKLQALGRYERVERNYVDTKLHQYSNILVKVAVDNHCGTIVLIGQKEREEHAKMENQKGNSLILRNWSYFNLKNKIKYKAAKYGIEVPKVKGDDGDKDVVEEVNDIVLE